MTEGLPPLERAARYRELAAEVQHLAETTRFVELRTSCLNLARRWAALADEVERGIENRDLPATIRDVFSAAEKAATAEHTSITS